MAESTYEEHGTIDEFKDLFCDTCYEGKGLNVKVYGFCKECFQFMCSDCHLLHSKFPLAKGHTVLRGSSMPQFQADKPPKFHYCDIHPKLLRNEFCSAHKILICSSCSSSTHDKCSVEAVDIVCKTMDVSEINTVYNDIKTLQDQVKSVHSSLETNLEKLAHQKETIRKEAQAIYDKIISDVGKLLEVLQSDIETTYQSQELLISQQQERIDILVNRLESVLRALEKFKGKPIDTTLFLKVQDLVTDTRQIANEFKTARKSLCLLSISFKPDKAVQDFLLPSVTFGSVSKSEGKYGTDITVNDIVFPCSQHKPPEPGMVPPQQSNPPGMAGQQRQTARLKAPGLPVPLSKIKATRQYTHSLKLRDDKLNCFITALAITKDRNRISVDYNNRNVKMFSDDMKFLSSVSVSGRPCGIAVISELEAAVTADNNSLVILDISSSQLSIKTTTQLRGILGVRSISSYNGKIVVTSLGSIPPSVKGIDQTIKVYWTVSSDQRGQPLFSRPWYVSSHIDGSSSTVLITDEGNHTLTLLDGNTGEIINRRQLKEIYPRGVTTDSAGNVYVCYRGPHEVSVLSGDLSEEKILLSRRDGLSDGPQAIVYSDEAHQLIISNSGIPGGNDIDVFQLS